MSRSLLVVGAQDGSIGQAVARGAYQFGWDVVTAGLGPEDHHLDLTEDTFTFLTEHNYFDVVVCTAGVNPTPRTTHLEDKLLETLYVNAAAPIAFLDTWITHGFPDDQVVIPQFVVVSSNSAHIARSQSLPYCASKAALSMAVRCAARQLADSRITVWGVEPGWVEGTPMSERVMERLGPETEPHRIPGDRTLDTTGLAEFILVTILGDHLWLNGCMLRLDGGEQ